MLRYRAWLITRLKDFQFVSNALTGQPKHGSPGNRFADSWLGTLPVPVPKQYLLGIDVQKRDFENFGRPSYLSGEGKKGGWWYYYLYGLAVKTPHGTQLLFLLAVAMTIVQYGWRCVSIFDKSQQQDAARGGPAGRDLVALLVPAVALLVSSQLEFNHHLRYVLPIFGFLFVFIAATVSRFFS